MEENQAFRMTEEQKEKEIIEFIKNTQKEYAPKLPLLFKIIVYFGIFGGLSPIIFDIVSVINKPELLTLHYNIYNMLLLALYYSILIFFIVVSINILNGYKWALKAWLIYGLICVMLGIIGFFVNVFKIGFNGSVAIKLGETFLTGIILLYYFNNDVQSYCRK